MTRRIMLVLTAALLGGACENATGPDPVDQAVASVEVSAPAAGLEEGGTLQLSAIPRTRDGRAVSAPVVWSSGNASVATVSAAGVVSALGEGTAVIAATSEGKRGEVTLSVGARAVSWMEITPAGDLIQPTGSARQLGVVLHAADGSVLPARTVVWSTSDETVVSVTAGGVIGAVRTGRAVITATLGDKQAHREVLVPTEIATVQLDRQVIEFGVGDSVRVVATVKDVSGAVVTPRLTWTSNNSAVAAVDSNGIVVARGRGTTTINATVEGRSASVRVTVGEWSTRLLVGAGGSALPAVAFDTTIVHNGAVRRVRFRAVEGRVRILLGDRFELHLSGWMEIEGSPATQATLSTHGGLMYDVFDGDAVFYPAGGESFRGRHLDDQQLEIDWRHAPGAPVMKLRFGAPN